MSETVKVSGIRIAEEIPARIPAFSLEKNGLWPSNAKYKTHIMYFIP